MDNLPTFLVSPLLKSFCFSIALSRDFFWASVSSTFLDSLPLEGVPLELSIPGKSIKRIGKYQASLRLHREVSTQLNFELLPEKK